MAAQKKKEKAKERVGKRYIIAQGNFASLSLRTYPFLCMQQSARFPSISFRGQIVRPHKSQNGMAKSWGE